MGPHRRLLAMLAVGVAIGCPALAGLAVAAGADTKPQRVVSMNLCTDQLVMLLADRSVIKSLYRTSTDPAFSYVADNIAGIPLNRGAAEGVLAFRPDVVIAGTYTTRATVALLRRLGTRVIELPIAESFAEIRSQLAQLGQALGEDERAGAIVADMDRRLAAVRASAPPRSAILLGPNLFSNGRGSLMDEVFRLAGLRNVAADLGLMGYGRLDLERIVAAAPEVLVIPAGVRAHPSLAASLLRHPALRRLGRDGTVVNLPSALWTCAGPFTVEAVEQLAGVGS
ncbi:MAG: ABC transporter substrate-binding protein [Alphaproteobacteria bacterium]|nr:ABC transporter substrate-binding protein [Alphaproteobacteria bacterium]